MQLDVYDTYNRFLRVANSDAHQQRKADTLERYNEIVAARTQHLNHAEGESLTIEDKQDIWCQVKGEERAAHNFSLNTRSKTGDISDYLEARRPFGAAQ